MDELTALPFSFSFYFLNSHKTFSFSFIFPSVHAPANQKRPTRPLATCGLSFTVWKTFAINSSKKSH